MLSVDFVVELPLSSGHNAVMTVVDSVSKRAYFIPMHTTVTVEGAARLFLHQVWKLHGLPKCIISDCGPQFIAHFTKELYRLLGIKLASSTAWHPQTDRQMEHVNQELDQYLWLFVNERQDDWYDLLPMAEFQHNNHVHSATQHQKAPPHGLRTPTKPLQSGDGQRIHRENENGDRRSEVRDPQGTGRHEKVLRPQKNSGAGVQPWQQGLPRRIGHLDYTPFAETLTSTTWLLHSGSDLRPIA